MTLIFLFLFLLVNFLYIKIWSKFSNKVPTGIGIFLTIPCYFFFLEQNLYFISIAFIIIFSFIYFLDDLVEINFIFRILLQIFVSLVIYFSFSTELNWIIIFINIVIFLILVNTFNFQDGEDLNIASLLFIIFGIFYYYAENNFIQKTSEVILLFLISFSLFNVKKKSLYFGDSGCYFSAIIIFLFAYNEVNNLILIKFLIAIIVFPIVDVFYVLTYRVIKKQNLLSRNYLHLYQVLAQKFNNKIYLLPNFLFSLLNILISLNFSLGKNLIIILIILNAFLLFAIQMILMKISK